MAAPERVAIVGTGLIGASLGLALKRVPAPPSVIGFDQDPKQLRAARGRGALDRHADSLLDAVQGADLVVLATPVRAIESIMREVGNLLPAGTVVTDTASTKGQVVAWAARLLPKRVGFVGGHPMAGKLTAQADGPDARLFQGAIYCLTPDGETDAAALDRVTWLVEAIGAQTYFLEATEHDALVALVSHLPYLLAATLMDDLAMDGAWRELSTLAAGGLIAATALAEGDPKMFGDICLTNRAGIAAALERFTERLATLREQVLA